MGWVKIVFVIMLFLLVSGFVFSVPQRLVTQAQYESLKTQKTSVLNITGEDARQIIVSKINNIDASRSLIENGHISSDYLFSVEQSNGSLLYNIISQVNRGWLALLTDSVKNLSERLGITETGLAYEKCRNDAYDYCFVNNSTLAGIRTCLNTRILACN